VNLEAGLLKDQTKKGQLADDRLVNVAGDYLANEDLLGISDPCVMTIIVDEKDIQENLRLSKWIVSLLFCHRRGWAMAGE